MVIKKNINDVEIGMILAQEVTGPQGVHLIPENTALIEEHLTKLKQWNIDYVFIKVESEDERIEKEEIKTRQIFQKAYSNAVTCLQNIKQNISSEKAIKIEEIEAPVKDMMAKVNENRDVLMQLTRLNMMENHLFSHSINVCVYALVVGKYLNLAGEQLLELGTTALLHDIGMVKIEESLWNNNRPVSDNSWQHIKKHPHFGAEILEQSGGYSRKIIEGIKHHHERINGSGYPLGLKGDEISFYGGIVGLVNVFESLTAYRKYREPVIPNEAMKIILAKGRNHFAPEFLRALVAHIAIYPIGSLVMLNTGEIAQVTGVNPEHPFRPKLKVLFDCERNQQTKARRLDLKSKKHETTYVTKTINQADIDNLTSKQ